MRRLSRETQDQDSEALRHTDPLAEELNQGDNNAITGTINRMAERLTRVSKAKWSFITTQRVAGVSGVQGCGREEMKTLCITGLLLRRLLMPLSCLTLVVGCPSSQVGHDAEADLEALLDEFEKGGSDRRLLIAKLFSRGEREARMSPDEFRRLIGQSR